MRKFSVLGFLFVSLLMFGLPTFAKTPDRQTPAKENVCDPLKYDGVTKGLYGLCVAFCEAHDAASLSTPITEDGLLAIEESSPNGRILKNYNKRKASADPPMPCISVEQPVRVEQPCPCWTEAELDALDGLRPDGSTARTSCVLSVDPNTGIIVARSAQEQQPQLLTVVARDFHLSSGTTETCLYFNGQVVPSQFTEFPAGTLTHEQAAACLQQVNSLCTKLGF